MTKLMQLRCQISESDTPGTLLVKSTMFDGTPFSIKVPFYKCRLNEPISEEKPVVEGWIPVEQTGEQEKRVGIVLPAPTIEYGKNISVSTFQLMPFGVQPSDFLK